MSRRARRVLRRIDEFLPVSGEISDIGSGTGHNADLIRQQTACNVAEFDVADLHWVGPGPTLIDDVAIGRDSNTQSAVLLLYVLHYLNDAESLLVEARRLCSGQIIVLQSTYNGSIARQLLKVQEFFCGSFGYYAAKLAGLISAQECTLHPATYFTRKDLLELFRSARLNVVETRAEPSLLCRHISRDLYVLEADETGN